MNHFSKGSTYLKGLLMPESYNSKGKIISFFIKSECGQKFLLKADNLLKILRKNTYRPVTVRAQYRQRNGKEYYLIKGRIRQLDYYGRSS